MTSCPEMEEHPDDFDWLQLHIPSCPICLENLAEMFGAEDEEEEIDDLN